VAHLTFIEYDVHGSWLYHKLKKCYWWLLFYDYYFM